ncbi:MAG: hypothetical protein HYY84_08415 [Deltaproteobacteria bacterium]|nr:hypothetical protein [Deltaproteobacteria bacterium]
MGTSQLRKATGFGALAAFAFAASACSTSGRSDGTLIVKVRLASNYNTEIITGLRIILDGAGEAALSLPNLAPTQGKAGLVAFTYEVADCDGDGKFEFCVTFATNPIAGTAYDFSLYGSWPENVGVRIKCQISYGDGSKKDTASTELAEDGTTARFVQGRALAVVCNVGCTTGESCVGTIPAPTLTEVIPASPANNNAPKVRGTATDSSQTITLYGTSDCSSASLGQGSGAELATTGITALVLDNTINTIFARATDSQNRASACSSTSVEFVEDSAAPAAPTALTTSPSLVANDNAPKVRGFAERYAMVRVYAQAGCDAGAVATGTAADFGDAGIAVSVADDSTTTFFATAMDDAGNVSTCSSVGATFREDSTALAPTVTGISPTPPANTATVRVFGSAEANSGVDVFDNASCDGGVLGRGSSTDFMSDAGVVATVTRNAALSLYARIVDDAGNVSTCSSTFAAFVEDSTAPLAPSGLATNPIPPANNNGPRVFGSAEPLSTVRIYSSGTCDGGVLATGTASDFVDGGIALAVVDDASVTLYASATDDAGNVSGCSLAGFLYIEDSQPPAAPTGLATNPTSPANNNAPKVSGSAEAESTVRIFSDSLCDGGLAATGSAVDFADGGFTIAVPDDASVNFYATATDLAGNVSGCSVGTLYLEDSTAPAPPAMFTAPVSPANNNSPTFYGYAEVGSTVRVFDNAACDGGVVATQTAALFTLGFDASVGDNSTTAYYATATDPAGNASACALAATYVEDSLVPDAAVITASDPASPSGWISPRIIGYADPNTTVRLYADSLCDGGTIGTGSATLFSGAGVVAFVTADASTTVYADVADFAGNRSLCSAAGLTYQAEGVTPTSVACGTGHTCGVAPNGVVKCWGQNVYGQLGDNAPSATYRTSPVSVQNLDAGAFTLAQNMGSYHSCAIRRSDGAVWCWGRNSYEQLGVTGGDRYTAVAATGVPSGVRAVALGRLHSCALTDAGGVMCWGDNEFGQLGNGTLDAGATATDVAGLDGGVASISAGAYFSCAVTTGGAAKCWGYNANGELGNDAGASSAVPVDVWGLDGGIVQVGAGQLSVTAFACALSDAGAVKCWGNNDYGQLGNDAGFATKTPVDVVGLAGGVKAIAVGASHACAVRTSGALECWGSNSSGELGDGTIGNRNAPTSVGGLDGGVEAVSAGYNYTCAKLSVSGYVVCWGNSSAGILGDGTPVNNARATPVVVPGLAAPVATLAVGDAHSCALTTDGGVYCWGTNWSGELGDGTGRASAGAPVQPIGLASGVTQLTSYGSSFTCARMVGGGVKCWGDNQYGQLGDGTSVDRAVPTDVAGLDGGVARVFAYGARACAITDVGGLKCWGLGTNGELGDDGGVNRLAPVDVWGLDGGIIDVVFGNGHGCALSDAGAVWCWGQNGFGQLGDGTTTTRLTPVPVTGLSSGAKAIGAAVSNTCALKGDGSLVCWGSNDYGQVGNATTTTPQNMPVGVATMDGGVTMITVGYQHACGLMSSGGLRCWGRRLEGQVGDGVISMTPVSSPVDVGGLGSGVQLAVAFISVNCALRTGGELLCWGENSVGQVGNGTTADTPDASVPIGTTTGITAIAMGQYHTCAAYGDGGVTCWGYDEYGPVNARFSGYPHGVIGFSE